MIEELTKKNQEMLDEMAKIRKRMEEESKVLLEKVFQECFEKCPAIHQFHWTQYTPYFNDGESCTFSVNDVCFVLVDDLDEDGEWDEGFYNGSTVYSEEDIKSQNDKLAVATAFKFDPVAWRKAIHGESAYNNAVNMPYHQRAWQQNRILEDKPYYTVEMCERNIQEIKNWLDKYGDEAEAIKKYTDAVAEFIMSIDEGVMQNLFGDHVCIVATRDGIEIDGYEHD